jgi:light-regulated signal transduction histidine kinase (bacteriophytochrome)
MSNSAGNESSSGPPAPVPVRERAAKGPPGLSRALQLVRRESLGGSPLVRKLEEYHRLNECLEQRVRERTEQLEAMNRELGLFAEALSHDLRAPLRHLEGFLEILVDHLGPQEDAITARCIDRVRTASRQMSCYLDALRQFSRLDRQAMALELVDLNALVAELEEAHSFLHRPGAVVWVVAELPTILGDPSLIRAVFQNLIDNALKFSAGSHPPCIEVGRQPSRSGEAVVFVRDNGVGFDPAQAGRLFGVFQRLHPPEEFEGTGIGLANVQRIVHRHGGRVWAEGQVGKGATFYVALPTP